MQYLALACVSILGGTFVISVASKLWGAAALHAFIQSLRVLPIPGARWPGHLATVALSGEAACIFALFLPGTRQWGFALSVGILSVYTGMLNTALRHGSTQPCHCFGLASNQPISHVDITRNVLLISVGLTGFLATDAAAGQPTSPSGAAIAILAGLLLAVAVSLLDDLRWAFGRHEFSPRSTKRGGSGDSAAAAARR
jgi:uncharacterized membrane protein